jgi:diaminohydroxyphosphoribosylaminopyrimidine deaminase/5-amino-6-(5-phosphoribosylamino)uracil reductase
LKKRGIDVLRIPVENVKGKTDLVAMMLALAKYNRGINHIMVETGAKLNASLLAAGLVDEIVFYMAPSLLGDTARGLFALPELARLKDKIQLAITDTRQIGTELKISARLV